MALIGAPIKLKLSREQDKLGISTASDKGADDDFVTPLRISFSGGYGALEKLRIKIGLRK